MIDGALARKLNSVNGTGAVIDSLADLVFVICSAILVLPTIDLPLWIWLWIAAIGVIKLVGIVLDPVSSSLSFMAHPPTYLGLVVVAGSVGIGIKNTFALSNNPCLPHARQTY